MKIIAKRIVAYEAAICNCECEIVMAAQAMVYSDEYVTEEKLRGLLNRREVLRFCLGDLKDIERELAAQMQLRLDIAP